MSWQIIAEEGNTLYPYITISSTDKIELKGFVPYVDAKVITAYKELLAACKSAHNDVLDGSISRETIELLDIALSKAL